MLEEHAAVGSVNDEPVGIAGCRVVQHRHAEQGWAVRFQNLNVADTAVPVHVGAVDWPVQTFTAGNGDIMCLPGGCKGQVADGVGRYNQMTIVSSIYEEPYVR